MNNKRTEAPSPLHTPKTTAKLKKEFIQQAGKDADGAYRVNGRLDADKVKEAA